MNLKDACEKVGGRVLDDNVCLIGKNLVKQLDPFHFEIVTPRTTLHVRAPGVKVSGSSLRLLFNNCGVEVSRDYVEMACFAPGKDNDLNVYFEEVFRAVV